MKKYHFSGHLSPTPEGYQPFQLSGDVYLASDVEALLRENQRQLIDLAAKMVRGEMLPDIDADQFCKTTPVTVRRNVMLALEKAHDSHKGLGMKVKALADRQSPPQGVNDEP